MQKHLKVIIGGKQYTIAATDENETDIQCAAKIVDNLLQERLAASGSGVGVAVLDKTSLIIALQLGMDLIKHQQQLMLYEKKLEQLSSLIS